MGREYKVIAIVQVYNELKKGNLERFFRYNLEVFDKVIVYDDGSTDGSFEYSQKFTPYVIRSPSNNFENEVKHKSILLEYAKRFSPDFIFWIDADEVVSAPQVEGIQEACRWCELNGIDGLRIRQLNLWRSNTFERVDTEYNQAWPTRLWRLKANVEFKNVKTGLHQESIPNGIEKIARYEKLALIHYGFSDIKNIVSKYITYKNVHQRGYHLRRLVDETDLTSVALSKDIFPDGLWVDEDKPLKMKFEDYYKIIMETEAQLPVRFSIVSLIYKSVSWLEFVYRQVMIFSDLHDSEFFFVANDADKAVLDYLKANRIKFYLHENTVEQKKEWYINNVYRAWNTAGEKCKGDFVVFINSDMAFTSNWLENLFLAYDGRNCVTSRLVESAKLRSGTYGIEKNFGRLIEEYNESAFQAYANHVSKKEVHESGLYMPLLIKKSDFEMVDGYPEGNIVIGSDIWKPKIATKNDHLMPGDQVFMLKLAEKGIKHQTSFDSVVYHFQCGEMDDLGRNEDIRVWRNVRYLGKEHIQGEQKNYSKILSKLVNVTPVDFSTKTTWEQIKEKVYFQLNPSAPIPVEIVLAPISEIGKLPMVNNRRYVFVCDDDDLPREQEKNIYDLALKDRNDFEIVISSIQNMSKFLFCEPKIVDFSQTESELVSEFEGMFTDYLDMLTAKMYKDRYEENLGTVKTKWDVLRLGAIESLQTIVKPFVKHQLKKPYRAAKLLLPGRIKQSIKTLLGRT
ncbi:MAG: glycosyltransferase [Bdellovibrionaceae bacterium]|nr:glycosyltransferase [Pseudobdellovibrionaceae bacterium]